MYPSTTILTTGAATNVRTQTPTDATDTIFTPFVNILRNCGASGPDSAANAGTIGAAAEITMPRICTTKREASSYNATEAGPPALFIANFAKGSNINAATPVAFNLNAYPVVLMNRSFRQRKGSQPKPSM
jgi:hypothetical protein